MISMRFTAKRSAQRAAGILLTLVGCLTNGHLVIATNNGTVIQTF